MAGIPQVITEDRASGAQFIDGSLRFDESKGQYLKFTPSASGNRRTQTLSVWIKNTYTGGNNKIILGGGDNASGPRHNIAYNPTKQFGITQNPTGSTNANTYSAGVFRDYSGWQHLVMSLDCTVGANSGQVRIWVNGVPQDNGGYGGGNAAYISDQDGIFNTINKRMYLGHYAANPGDPAEFDGYMSQFYWIDGLAIGPGYFGYTDPLTGTWRPKKFRAEGTTVNDGTTWSSTTDSGLTYADGVTGIFDGNLSTRGGAPSTNNNYAILTNNVSIPCTHGIRIYWNGVGSGQRYIRINGTIELDDGSAQLTPGWSPLSSFSGTINKIEVKSASSGSWSLAAIEVDGVIMKDNTTQSLDFGTNGAYLPFDGNTPIGQDQSGKGNNWEPVNFGGSVELSKATGAIPILNTNEAGTVAKKGVRTDSKTYTVTASGGKYYLDGALTPTLSAYRGGSYTFDYTGATSHPFYLSSLPDGSHNSKAYSVSFDGTGDYLGVTGTSDVQFGTGAFTAECFVYANSLPGSGVYGIFDTGSAVNANRFSLVLYPNGKIYIDNNSNLLISNHKLSPNTWNHIAFVREGTGTNESKLYINGVLSNQATINTDFSNDDLLIGKTIDNLGWNGYISNVRIVKGRAVYTSNFTPPTTTLTNVSNTTLLCCQDSNATTGAVVPNGVSITANGNAAASQTKQPFLYNSNGDLGVNTGTSNVTKITIPHTAADTLYYYCSAHSGMGSSINVTTDVLKADPYAWKCVLAMPLVGGSTDESANINVNSSAKTFAVNGNTTSRGNSNHYGGSLYFDGSGDYLGATSNADFAMGTGDFTLECWVYRDSAGGFTNFMATRGAPGSANGYTWGAQSNGNGNDIEFYTNVLQLDGGSQKIENKKWHHVAITRSGNTLSSYVNGILNTTALNSQNFSNTSLAIAITNDASQGPLNGYLQDVRAYKGVAKYTENFVVGSTAPDVLPDTPSGVSGKSKLTKIIEGAVAFDGANDELKVNDDGTDLQFGTGDFTFETFVYYNVVPSSSRYIVDARSSGGTTNTYALAVGYSGDNAILEWAVTNSAIVQASWANYINTKSWTHIAVTRSGSTIKMFINGEVVDTATDSTDYINPSEITIGDRYINSNATQWFNGFISDFRIVKGTALYTSNFTPPTEPLTAVTNTKLLCCQSSTSASTAAVAPGTFINDGTDYSSGSQVTGSSGLNSVDSLFDGRLRASGASAGDAATVSSSSDNYILWTPTTGIPYTSKVEVYCYAANGYDITNYYTFNGGTETTFTGGSSNFNGNNWITVATGSGTINSIKIRITRGGGNATSVHWYAVRVDGTILINDYNGKSLAKFGDVAATNFTPFTDDINTIRGQESGYATWNPLSNSSGTLSEGNLSLVGNDASGGATRTNATLAVSSGKWYFEVLLQQAGTATDVGIAYNDITNNAPGVTNSGSGDYGYLLESGVTYNNNSSSSYGSSLTTGDTFMCAFDVDTHKLYFGKNGIWFGSSNPATGSNPAFNITSGLSYRPIARPYGNGVANIQANFGQKPFKFPPPDGFQPLNLSNTQPEKVFVRPDQYVGVSLWNGNGTSQTITGLKHKPDFVWLKKRTGGTVRSHQLFDSVRGVHKSLHSDSTSIEDTNTGRLTAFNQDGFAVGGDDGANGSGGTFVGWTWKAGGDKNTFNIDDVGYANASDVNMNVGVLNSSLYNTSRRWSDGIANSSSVFDQAAANAFNGDRANQLRTADNSVLVTLNFSPALTVASTIEILAENYSTANFRYTVTVDGTTTTKDVVGAQPGTFNVSGSLTQITFDNNNSNGRTYLQWIKVDGKELIDNNVTINTPSIAPTGCSVGTKQGFSIVKWQGDGSDANRTVPHGLLEAPSFVIVKPLTEARHWLIWHKGYNDDDAAMLFDTGVPAGSRFGPAAPTSNVFGVYGGQGNRGTTDFIGYCWHDVPGLQKFGTYAGNGSGDGPFVELGFKPAIIWMKNISDGSNRHWCVVDSTRSTNNKSASAEVLFFDSNQIESRPDDGFGQFGSKPCVDILSNGFKLREANTSGVWTQVNNTHTYIYCAWAEAPAVNLYGGQSNAF